VKVRLEVLKLIAATKFDKGYTLTMSIKCGGKVVEMGQLCWRIRSRDSMRLKRTGCGIIVPEMGLGLGTIIHSENAHHDLIKLLRKVQGTNAASEGGTFVLIALEFRGEGGTQRSGGPCKDHLSTGGVRFHDGEIMFTCEFLDFREVFGGSMLTGGILCSGERFALVLDCSRMLLARLPGAGARR